MQAQPEAGVSAPNAPQHPAGPQAPVPSHAPAPAHAPMPAPYTGAQPFPGQQAAPQQAMPQQAMPQQGAPQQGAPQQAMPQQAMPHQQGYGQPVAHPQAAHGPAAQAGYGQPAQPAGYGPQAYGQAAAQGSAPGYAAYGAAAAAGAAAVVGGAGGNHYAGQAAAPQHAAMNLPPVQIGPLPTYPVQHEKEPKHTPLQLNDDLPVDHMLAKVSHLFAQDKSAELKNKRLLTWGLVCLFGGLFTAVFLIGIPILIIGIGLLIYRSVGSASKQDVEDRKLEVIAGVLRGLRGEIRSNRPVHVGADFGAYPNTQPVEYSEAGTGIFESKTTAASYRHWWLNMRFALVDGTGVTLDVIQHAKRKTAQKRKYTKTKDRVIERINVKINAPRGKTFGASVLNRQWKSERFNGLLLKRVVVRPNYAVFQYQAAAVTRVRGRGGWFAQNLEAGEVTSPRALAAIVNSYKSVASVQHAS